MKERRELGYPEKTPGDELQKLTYSDEKEKTNSSRTHLVPNVPAKHSVTTTTDRSRYLKDTMLNHRVSSFLVTVNCLCSVSLQSFGVSGSVYL